MRALGYFVWTPHPERPQGQQVSTLKTVPCQPLATPLEPIPPMTGHGTFRG